MLDLDNIIHALVVTVVAGYIAYVYYKSKLQAAAAGEGGEEVQVKRQVGYEGIIPPSRGMAMGVVQHEHHPEPAAVEKKPEVVPVVVAPEVVEVVPEVVPEVTAPVVVEEIAVVEKESVPEPVVVAEPEPEPVVVPEPVEEALPELIVPEPMPEPEVVPEPVKEPEVYEPVEPAEPAVVETLTFEPEAQPEPMMDEAPVYVAEYASEHIHEPEPFNYNDSAAVDFTPGKKQSKFETLMTKEEMEDEQSSRASEF